MLFKKKPFDKSTEDWLLYWHFDFAYNGFQYVKTIKATVQRVSDERSIVILPPRIPVHLLANPKRLVPRVFSSYDEADKAMTIMLYEWETEEREASITVAAIYHLENKQEVRGNA